MSQGRPAWWWHALVIGVALQLGVLTFVHRHVFAVSREAYDVSWHMVAGRIFHETGQVARADPLCFTSEGLPWVQTDWLSDVILYRSYLWLGFEGPAALASTVFVLTFVVLLQSAREKGASALTALLALAPLAWIFGGLTDVRPRTVSYLLLAVFLWVLDRPDPQRRFDPRLAALLGALLVVWCQLHGEVLLGFAALGIDAVASAVAHWRATGTWRCRRAVLLLLAAAGGALLGFALHPQSLDVLRDMFQIALAPHNAPLVVRVAGDLWPLPFTSPLGRIVEVGVVTALLALWLGGPRPGLRDALLTLLLLHTALVQQRAVVPLLVVAGPWVAASVTGALELRLGTVHDAIERRLAPGVAWLRWSLLVALAGWLLLFVPGRASPGVPGEVPLNGAWSPVNPLQPALLLQRTPGRVFSDIGMGGVLGWAVYPARRLFIDGRGNIHRKGTALEEYVAIMDLEPGWLERLDAHRIELVVVWRHRPLHGALRQLGWRVLWEDAGQVVLGRP